MIKFIQALSPYGASNKNYHYTNIPGHNIGYSATSSLVPRLSPPPLHKSLGTSLCYFKWSLDWGVAQIELATSKHK